MKKFVVYVFVFIVIAGCQKSGLEQLDIQSLPYDYKNTALHEGARFDSVPTFTAAQLENVDGIYGSNNDFQSERATLPFTFYAPRKSLDPLSRRPFIMLVHGGEFLNGSYTDLVSVARSFAIRGYATASIQYRQGFNPGNVPCLNGDSIEVLKAVYRATQDANAAMRYFVANAATLGIDTSQLFVFGTSAGSVTTTSMIYYPQSFFDSKIPGLQSSMGGLNNATNTLTNTFSIKAELTTTGYGLLDRTLITATNCKPSFYMQGGKDATLPANYGPVFQCPAGTYGHSYGALSAKQLVKSFRYPYELYIDESAEHDVSGNYPEAFYVARMASFIKRLWGGNYRWLEYSTLTQKLNRRAG